MEQINRILKLDKDTTIASYSKKKQYYEELSKLSKEELIERYYYRYGNLYLITLFVTFLSIALTFILMWQSYVGCI